MATVLFLSAPAHGNVNPTLGLVRELIKQGEQVVYFSSPEFKEKIEETGAIFKSYSADLNFFKMNTAKGAGKDKRPNTISQVIKSGPSVVSDILEQTREYNFDYLIHSAAFPFAKPMAQIFKVPTVSSLAIFAGLDIFFESNPTTNGRFGTGSEEMRLTYNNTRQEFQQIHGVNLPENMLQTIFNKGDINLVYTSSYFAGNITYFDDSFKFVGPPVDKRSEDLNFPFERLEGKKVLYISLGTVFSGYNLDLYNTFFEAFKNWNGIVVMAAHNIDQSQFQIPANFMVRDFVPQNALLKYTTAAITHAGLNSMSDLLSHNIPFVCLPMGADQPLLAQRAAELGATISLDVNTVTPDQLNEAIETVLSEPTYLQNIKLISDSFAAAGGYKKAVEEIFALKTRMGITA